MSIVLPRGKAGSGRNGLTSRPEVVVSLRARWDTPSALRATRGLVVVFCLLAGALGVTGARILAATSGEIDTHSEPLSTDILEAYRSLAEADTTVAEEFLLSGTDPAGARRHYDDDVTRAAGSLARASSRSGPGSVTAQQVNDIAIELPVYAGLVERARGDRIVNSSVAVDDLRAASDLMQSTILRRLEALQGHQSQHLQSQYHRARRAPAVALWFSAMCLLALFGAQVVVFRKSKRIFNVGLLAATAGVVVGVLVWTAALAQAGSELTTARRRSQFITNAIGQGQIAATQARASELLALVAPDGASYRRDFADRFERLDREDGTGGALGAARRFASDADSRDRVRRAAEKTRAWDHGHAEVVRLSARGRHREAVALAIDTEAAGAGRAFVELEETLTQAVGAERAALRHDIAAARHSFSWLAMATAVLALAVTAGAAWGVGQRLEEYR